MKRLCVVIDTNIWRSELLLKSPKGVAFVYALARQDGLLGLPEVIENELPKQIIAVGRDATTQSAKHVRTIQTLDNSWFCPDMPDEERLKQLVSERLIELQPIITKVPLTLEQTRRALSMAYQDLPPNSPKNQQVKDSLIWQAVLELSKSYSIHFITHDFSFFANRDESAGLAPNLIQDCKSAGVQVNIYSDLKVWLEGIRSNAPQIDKELLTSLILERIRQVIDAEALRNKFIVRELLSSKISAFQTSEKRRIAIDYEFVMRHEPDAEIGETARRGDFQIIVRGGCYYEDNHHISNEFVEEIKFQWKYLTGGEYSGSGTSARWFESPIPFPRPENQ